MAQSPGAASPEDAPRQPAGGEAEPGEPQTVPLQPFRAASPAAAIPLLTAGELEIVGRLVEASNLNLYCRVTLRDHTGGEELVATCVYKPIDGEQPLHDFPDGTLAYREVAAYQVSQATGWNIVPPTVLRDGPLGVGMVQLWMDVDPAADVVGLIQAGDPALRRMALFDAVVNNADRKGGHMLPVAGGHVYGVDHGVCFSTEPKLRTILWGWRGQRLRPDELAMLERLADEMRHGLGADLRHLLAVDEVAATARRIHRLLSRGTFPQPNPNWPAVPWPPF